ncbi:MAG: hypothetical protein LBQ40_00645 [Clostridiales bacterium]|jgi:hypothetical protein|nr:hypothetical protein [Clostridiales bacterium]
MGLFKKKQKYKALLNLSINAKLQPLDRGEIFEDALNVLLKRVGCGYVDGGGTLLGGKGKEIEYCDVDIFLTDDSEDTRKKLIAVLNELCPKGSLLSEEGKEPIVLGLLEGYAVYLNGYELPDEVYKTSDINYVISELKKSFEGEVKYYSWWKGPTETALYFYGKSFDAMKEKAGEFIASYPLCQKCRIVRLPDKLPC